MDGADRRRFQSLAAFSARLADPWVALADWNATPEELMRTGFPQKVQGELLLTRDPEATCFKGSGKLIDYGLLPHGASDLGELEAVLDVPWQARAGLRLRLAAHLQTDFSAMQSEADAALLAARAEIEASA
ncbi:unnamed protein product, partial [Prorocentrum cordatum]